MTSDGTTKPCACRDNDCARPALPSQLFCQLCLDGNCPTVRDIQLEGPADCKSCDPHRGGPVGCLSHTCPDCGSIVHGLTNDRGELVHSCPR